MNINRQLGELREQFGGITRFDVIEELNSDIQTFAENYPEAKPNNTEEWMENNGLRGFADLVEMDDGFRIKEFKTGKERERDRFQAATYTLPASIKAGKQVEAEVVYLPDYDSIDVEPEMVFEVIDTWHQMTDEISGIKSEVKNDLQRHYGYVDASTLEDTVRLLKEDNDDEEVQDALETLVEHEVRMNQ